jgi:hypothetical protein
MAALLVGEKWTLEMTWDINLFGMIYDPDDRVYPVYNYTDGHKLS